MKKPENKTVLIVIAVALIGILAFLALGQPREKTLGESIDEASEEISDEIDDHTRQ